MPLLDVGATSSLISSSSASDGTGDSDDKDERSDESSSADILVVSAVQDDFAVGGEVKDAESRACCVVETCTRPNPRSYHHKSGSSQLDE